MKARVGLVTGALVLAVVAAGCSRGGSDNSTAATAPSGRRRLVAPDGLRGILDRERNEARNAPTTSSSTTTTTLPSAPFPLAHTTMSFVDPSRGTPARGGAPAASSRTLVTTVYYPASTPPTADAPTPNAAAGRYPLIVFAHGYEIAAAAYAPLLRDLAVGGFVVAAPDFPGTSSAHPGGANRADTLQQPADLSFVITSMLGVSAGPGPLHDAIDPDAIGDSGHSDGGVTALAAAYNTCCIDPRIKAATILTGGAFGFEGDWFPPGTPPVMFVHATADEINPYGASTSMFEQAQSPKYLLTVEGGSHLEVFVDPPWEPQIAQAMTAFYDLHLKHDASAEARLQAVGNQPGLLSLQTG
jgi:alpha-beta hydrolase superfamily lysophospholipase